MKKIFFALLFICLFGATSQSRESLRIVSFQEDYLGSFNLQRHAFWDAINKNKDQCVDTTIVDTIQIHSFLLMVKELEFVKNLNVSTNQIEWDTLSIQRDSLFIRVPIEKNSLDNRMYISYKKDSICDVFWVSISQIDIEKKRFLLSDSLIVFLENILHCLILNEHLRNHRETDMSYSQGMYP